MNESVERKPHEKRQRGWRVKRGRRKGRMRGAVQVEGSELYPGSDTTFHSVFIQKGEETPTSQAGLRIN